MKDQNCAYCMQGEPAPRYRGGGEWGGTFQMDPCKVYLTDEEYGPWRGRPARRSRRRIDR